MGGRKSNKVKSKISASNKQNAKSKNPKKITPHVKMKSISNKNHQKSNKNRFKIIIVAVAAISVIAIIVGINHKSYEEYDLKGLTVKEACEKARGAGWEVDSIHHLEDYSDTTDCYNEKLTVSDYDYYKVTKSVTILFGKEGEKKTECESTGKWWRDGKCKSQEEWENDYAWKNAHAACKKYGSSGYAKTLTDCYVGSEYKGPVSGEVINGSQNNDTSEPSSTVENVSWRQVLNEYESWINKYVDFMIKYKNTSDYSALASMMSDYSTLLSELTEWNKRLDNVKGDLSASDLNEYIQTLARINQRLSEIK